MMRILYIGKFRKSYATENYVAYAFESLGHKVKKYEIAKSTFSGAAWHIQQFKPDIVLTAKSSKKHLAKLIPWCNSRNILTICWQWDLFWGYRSGRLPSQFRDSKYLFTTDGGHNEKWKELGIDHKVIRQGIHKPECQLFNIDNPTYDVAFIGSHNSYRQRKQLFTWLRDTYKEKFLHINGCRGISLNRTLANVKIIVGDSYNVKNYWSNRIYEMLGRGGFLLHPTTIGLSSEFVSGEHYIEFPRFSRVSPKRHLDEHLKPIIQKWLDPSQNEKRQAIKRASIIKCETEFTYEHRVKELLNHISISE